jgi:hypothetical protein
MADDLKALLEPTDDDTPVIKQMRDALDRRDKEAKSADRKNQNLEDQVGKLGKIVAKQTFQQAGLSDKAMELYFKVNDEADPTELSVEKVKEFAKEYGLQTASTEPAPKEEPKSEGATQEPEAPKEPELPKAPQIPQFNPQAGTGPVAGEPVTTQTIMEAIARGDDAFVAQVVAEEQARPGRIKFKYPHLLKDTEPLPMERNA